MMADKKTLAIIIQSGAFDRVHYALVIAAAAAAIERPVRLFFTMDACRSLRPADHLGDWPAPEKDLSNKGLATFEELITAANELGVAISVCEMGLKAADLAPADLRADIAIVVTGVVTFLNAVGSDAQVLFV